MIIYMADSYRFGLYTVFDLFIGRKIDRKLESHVSDKDSTMAVVSHFKITLLS